MPTDCDCRCTHHDHAEQEVDALTAADAVAHRQADEDQREDRHHGVVADLALVGRKVSGCRLGIGREERDRVDEEHGPDRAAALGCPECRGQLRAQPQGAQPEGHRRRRRQ